MKSLQKDFHGAFVISLDFELHWGVSETRTVDDYRENLDNERSAISQMLELFDQCGIHATWATVGFLFCRDKSSLLQKTENIRKPNYKRNELSNYALIPGIGDSHLDDPYHYAIDMIDKIRRYKYQEIGTHTFSHFYCLEEGNTVESFSDDLDLAINTAATEGIKINSIVFPRNQYATEYLSICGKKGLIAYRGNSTHWLYKSLSTKEQHLLRRLGRLVDTYINISGKNSCEIDRAENEIVNVTASRFLRPYDPKLRVLEPLRLQRLKSEMSFAAANKKLYHLWWHPHNFGKHLDKNMAFLKKILEHYLLLNEKYSFPSLNMSEVANNYN